MRHVQMGHPATSSPRKTLTNRCALATGLVLIAAQWVVAQRPQHYHFEINQPTGAIGAMQVARGVAPSDYIQPTKVIVPQGATISVASDETGTFTMPPEKLQVGLILGQPYRFKVTNIPRYEAQAIYPSIELIGRLHPPSELKDRFPIPVEITQEDLELAIHGQMVVRVIYLENPKQAFPEAETDQQRSIDVMSDEDPLQVADELGRPMAILRLGSRAPSNGVGDATFLFGAPPVSKSRPVRSDEKTALKSLPLKRRHTVDKSAVADPLHAEQSVLIVEPPKLKSAPFAPGQRPAPIVNRNDPFPLDITAESPSESK